MKLTNDIFYVGVNDTEIDLFESLYPVPDGMAYNSYVIADEKIAVMDSVDAHFTAEWLEKIEKVLEGLGERAKKPEGGSGRKYPDYLIIQHMEPDHSANIEVFMKKYPKAVLVASDKAFPMIKNYFGTEYEDRRVMIREGDKLSLGKHTLTFMMAPLVHWPEVMVTYDAYDKVLFTADAFGTFGTVEQEKWQVYQESAGEVIVMEETQAECGSTDVELWAPEARRYYFGIVGKFGAPVQKLLKKAGQLDIRMLCPLHGPVLKEDLPAYLDLYHKWSSYEPEEEGVLIAYASVYGNTKKAAETLAENLRERGYADAKEERLQEGESGRPKFYLTDLTRDSMSEAVANAFRFSNLVLASVTYNGMVFPPMREFIHNLAERGFCNRTVALIENGSWAPTAAFVMRDLLARCKNLTFTETTVRIRSAVNEEEMEELKQLAEELAG